MLGFKRFGDAAITMSGVELMNRIRKVSSTAHGCASKIPPRLLLGRQSFQRDDAMVNAAFFAPAQWRPKPFAAPAMGGKDKMPCSIRCPLMLLVLIVIPFAR